jgi:hypothetical protein
LATARYESRIISPRVTAYAGSVSRIDFRRAEGMILDVAQISPSPLESILVMVGRGAELVHVIGAAMQIVFPDLASVHIADDGKMAGVVNKRDSSLSMLFATRYMV